MEKAMGYARTPIRPGASGKGRAKVAPGILKNNLTRRNWYSAGFCRLIFWGEKLVSGGQRLMAGVLGR